MVIEFVFHFIVELFRSIKDKPRLFIYELIFKGFMEENQKQYQLKGRLVGNTKGYYKFESIHFKLPSDDERQCNWENCSGCQYCKKEARWEPNIEEKKNVLIKESILTINELKELGKSTTYDIVGSYTVSNSPKDLSYLSLKVYSGQEENKLRVIKCPNIRKNWLLFYIFFSMIVLYIGITTVLICINNWHNILNSIFGTHLVFCILGFILMSFTVFFLCVYWKCLSGYIILMQMKKYGVPRKTEKVSEKYLIPKIFEYMTGTESVDNIL